MHIICMSNSRKTTTASLLFFCLLQSALSSILHFLTFFFFFFVDEGKARDVRFSSYSLSNTGEALFPYVSRCLIFLVFKTGISFRLELHLGIMCLPGEQYDNASVKNLKFVQRDTNKCNFTMHRGIPCLCEPLALSTFYTKCSKRFLCLMCEEYFLWHC